MGKIKSVNCKMQNYRKESEMFDRFTINESRLTILVGMMMWFWGVYPVIVGRGGDVL